MFNVRRIHNFNAWSPCRALCSSNWLMILTCGSPLTVVVFDCGFPMIDPVTSRTYSHFRRGRSSHQRRCPLEKARDPATWHGQPCYKFLITVITFLVTLLGSVIFQSKLLVDVFGPKTGLTDSFGLDRPVFIGRARPPKSISSISYIEPVEGSWSDLVLRSADDTSIEPSYAHIDLANDTLLQSIRYRFANVSVEMRTIARISWAWNWLVFCTTPVYHPLQFTVARPEL